MEFGGASRSRASGMVCRSVSSGPSSPSPAGSDGRRIDALTSERAQGVLVEVETHASDTARAARTLHTCLALDPGCIDSPEVRRRVAQLSLDATGERRDLALIVSAIRRRPWWMPFFLWRRYG